MIIYYKLEEKLKSEIGNQTNIIFELFHIMLLLTIAYVVYKLLILM